MKQPVHFSVAWAGRAKAISGPSSALSCTLALTPAGKSQPVLSQSFNRNVAPAAYTETYTTIQGVTTGSYHVSVSFRTGDDGTGDVVGVAEAQVQVTASGDLPSITTSSKIETVEVSGPKTVVVWQSVAMEEQAKDGQGNLVAVSPGSVFWSVTSQGGQANIYDNNLVGAAIAGDVGVRATVDGVASPYFTVTVIPPARTIFLRLGATSPFGVFRYAAFQDGDGPWSQIQPDAQGFLEGHVFDSKNRYAFLLVYMYGTKPITRIYYSTANEANRIELAPTLQDQNNFHNSVGGSVVPPPSGAMKLSVMDSGNSYGAGTNSYNFGGLPPTGDIVAYSSPNDTMAVRRDVSFDLNHSEDFDYRSAEFVPSHRGTLSLAGGLAGGKGSFQWVTKNGTHAGLSFSSDGSLIAYPDASQILPEDQFVYDATSGNPQVLWKRTTLVSATPGDQTLTSSTDVVLPTYEVIPGSERRIKATWTGDSDAYAISYGAGGSSHDIVGLTVMISKGWLQGQTTYSTPELTAIPGYDPSWAIPATSGITEAVFTRYVSTATYPQLARYLDWGLLALSPADRLPAGFSVESATSWYR